MPIDSSARARALPKTPLSPTAAENAWLLDNIQGNILKPHAREHVICILIQFNIQFPADRAAVRERLASVAKDHITWASKQYQQARDRKSGGPEMPFGNIFLTAEGYRALNEPPRLLGLDAYFLDGMESRTNRTALGDPLDSIWEGPYQRRQLHAIVLLAHAHIDKLQTERDALVAKLSTFSTVLGKEKGQLLRNAQQQRIEPFGFVDGLSQPVFVEPEKPEDTAQWNPEDTDQWDPVEPLHRVLTRDHLANDSNAYGSFLVFRKLEQNVHDFVKAEKALAKKLGVSQERAAALVVGRYLDGTPLVLSKMPSPLLSQANNFNYQQDANGRKCPFQAHIRTANPRTTQSSDRDHRIVRRGIPYGKPTAFRDQDYNVDELPREGVGVLFMCFQASIVDQFAYIQGEWANARNFGPGRLDGVVGQQLTAGDPVPQQWPREWEGETTDGFRFGGFVTLKGGESFFAPSQQFFQHLAG